TMKIKTAIRTSISDGARFRSADQRYTCADQDNADPPDRRDRFSQEEITEDCNEGIPNRTHRLHIAEVCPGKEQHVRNEEDQKTYDPQPDRTGRERFEEDGQQCGGCVIPDFANLFHPLAEKHITEG